MEISAYPSQIKGQDIQHYLNPSLLAKKAPVASLCLGCSKLQHYFWRPPSELWTFSCLISISENSNKQEVKSPCVSFGSVAVCFQAKPSSSILTFLCFPQRLSGSSSSLGRDSLGIHRVITGQAATAPLLWGAGAHKAPDKTLLHSVRHRSAVNLWNSHKGGLSQLR